MFIFIKTTSSHEGNFRAERIMNSDAQFCLVQTFGAMHAPQKNVHLWYFFQKS